METLNAVLLNTALVALGVFVILLGGIMIRMLRGPGAATRFVALDMLTGLAVALLSTSGIVFGRRELLDVALGVAAFSFIGTIAVGVFLQQHQGSKE